MRIGNRGGRQLVSRFSSGVLIVILLVVLLFYTFKPFTSFGKRYEDEVGASKHESITSSGRDFKETSLDTFASALNDASIAASSKGSRTPDGSKDTTVPASDGAPPIQTPATVPSSQIQVTPKPQFDVVIAHHSEEPYYIKVWTDSLRSIPYVQELGMRMVIYTKGSMEPAAIKEASGADEVIQLPNAGREGSYISE